MTPKEQFLAALEKPPAERASFLSGLEPALRQRVQELLAAHAAAGSFLGEPAPHSQDETTAELQDPAATQDPEPTARVRAGAGSRRLGPYDLLEVLGQGGFGTVYRAFDHKLHRVVAVKTLSPELAAQGLARQRFLREARAAAAVRHENVVAIHAVDEEPMPHLVMEFISGKTLQQKIELEGALSTVEVLRIGSQIAAGLAAAHAQGLIHRDIKPSNILLENGIERVKISDFGLARAVDDSSISQSGIIAGTPMYMSPEQAEGKPLDMRSDLFSLGSTLYACAAGRPPFKASSTLAVLKKVVEEEPVPLGRANPNVPDWLAQLIAKLMAKEPAERFQSAKEVAELLLKHLADEQQPGQVAKPAAVKPSAAAMPPGAKLVHKPWFGWLVFAGIVGSAGALAYFWTPNAGLLLGTVMLLAGLWGRSLAREDERANAGAAEPPEPPPAPSSWKVPALAAVALLGGVMFGAATLAGDGWDQWLAVAGLVLFGVGFFGLISRLIQRRPLQPSAPTRPPERFGWVSVAIIGLGVLFLLVMLERKGFTNFQRLIWFLHHELAVQFPDASFTGEFYPTDDPPDRKSGYSLIMVPGGGPAAVIVNRASQSVRLKPGSYWLFVRRAGKLIEQRHVQVPWGGSQGMVIGDADAAAADEKALHGEWRAVAIRYLDGPELLPAALPLSVFQFGSNRMVHMKLPSLDARTSFKPVVVGERRWLEISGKFGGNYFRIEGDIGYRLEGGRLTLTIRTDQPSVGKATAKAEGIPVPVNKQRGLIIELERIAATKTKVMIAESTKQMELAREAWEQAKQQLAAGLVPPDVPLETEARWLEARIKRAEEANEKVAAMADLVRLVQVREELVRLAKQRVAAGIATADLVRAAEAELAAAREQWKAAESAIKPFAAKGDYHLLSNGQDLTGWIVIGGDSRVWAVENGMIVAKGGWGGWLMTEREYGDFVLELEFRLSAMGNSGVALRSPLTGNATFDGMEIQLIDDRNFLAAKDQGLKPTQRTGAIYAVVPPSRDATKPAGEWNTLRITALGRMIRVELNGNPVLDANLEEYHHLVTKGPDNPGVAHPGLARSTGHLGLQSHEGRVEFRNIRVKELAKVP